MLGADSGRVVVSGGVLDVTYVGRPLRGQTSNILEERMQSLRLFQANQHRSGDGANTTKQIDGRLTGVLYGPPKLLRV